MLMMTRFASAHAPDIDTSSHSYADGATLVADARDAIAAAARVRRCRYAASHSACVLIRFS